ncbi:aminotransferase class V-fold PLP-dependent enzyme [Granulosicoccus antarcticus]|uniref:2-aminoethylphosphonate--pyruvate transaminase n=1 Tax=Granulosicoccus antarcticus IMCC3135 TaxID=1192854 RepID=A0A2Z2NVQ4_9GAMM|nr:aminotransferase class V-fold PLP-dependent enzyme [Granulosicoccus antarcticus]ASJ71244.1 2-aminoethylphosphonate--pyruvate transaminase [Granulosicoccus antarcticus IMCC3135]
MSGLLDNVDPDGLLEYSVVYTDRAVNHMSVQFQQTMRDIHKTLTDVYSAHRAVIVPGSGSSGMEAVARQLCRDKSCLVIRNGWFSFRWSQIFDAGNIPSSHDVLRAQLIGDAPQSAFAPVPVEEVVATIARDKPDVVCAPHVETAAGMILPDDYIKAVAEAVHAYGGIFVLDCIASGTIWVDMQALGVDVLVSAPQKGWSGSPCAGLVMLSEHAYNLMQETTSDSFTLDLKKWSQIMEAYLDGKHAYHATMPTDSLIVFRDVMNETASMGFTKVKQSQVELGQRVRALLEEAGFVSVAANGFQAPGVAVYYTDNDELHSGKAFAATGMQIAAGVPLQIDEPAGFKTFRIGLFGLDKLADVDAAVERFAKALEQVRASTESTTV